MKRVRIETILTYLILTPGAATMVLPFLWMVSTSLKSLSEVFVFHQHFWRANCLAELFENL